MYPKYLQTAGYQTSWIGKWHLQATPQYFDYWSVVPGQGAYYNPDFIEMSGQTVRHEGYATDVITDKALKWLNSDRDASKPFCLVIGHKCPHRNWLPDTSDLHAFDNVKFPLPKTFYDTYEGRLAAQRQVPARGQCPGAVLQRADLRGGVVRQRLAQLEVDARRGQRGQRAHALTRRLGPAGGAGRRPAPRPGRRARPLPGGSRHCVQPRPAMPGRGR